MNKTSSKIFFNLAVFATFYLIIGLALLIGDYYYLYSYQPNVIYIHPFLKQGYWINAFTWYKVLGLLLLACVSIFSAIEYRIFYCKRNNEKDLVE
ncbi:hypothetical protein GYN12_06945 [Lactococcus piscium]|uniref:hypothetical protein n=1 Tax=Lactobacillales TaxID=186826 RepID=UPI0015DC7DE0|nr:MULTISPECIES: hypothetical protein [Lactobacillales]MCJ1972446.1 hypothetical protein [Lactococcus carnosus]MCJ1975709.1 hypothetical protein [Lactococcus carnosus]MCJ1985954.1 hypothetical protein [Lactococcus carnosus]MCJ1987100.1 hypothetical protein [Lactococcus carnosus]MCJ2004197.1 hypothetical protein [Lactococcus carnosus]